jgi:hypothetical protein
MTKITASLLAATALAIFAAPAFAADLPTGVVAAPAPAAATSNTLTFEADPEWNVNPASSTYQSLADWYGKATYSHSFGGGFSGAVAGQYTGKPSSGGFNGLYATYLEVSGAYKASLTSDFSVTITGGLGYTFGNTGYAGGKFTGSGGNPDLGNADDSFLYYFVQGALDYKLDSHWTWNVINARYRNAFAETWITPKVTTGITYNIDSTDAVYANVGYAWKDNGNGSGLLADKLNVAVGYKYSF